MSKGCQDPSIFDESFYNEWRRKRLQVTYDHLGKDFFKDKKVLEAGAANGHISNELQQLGAEIIAAEARQETIDVGKTLFPNLNFLQYDFDQDWTLGKFDVIIHFGLLYHLLDAVQALEDTLDNCNTLVLETSVSLDDDKISHHSDVSAVTEAYNYALGPAQFLGCNLIEEIFRKKDFNYKRILDPVLNLPGYHYDNIGAFRQRRAFWIAKKN